MEKTYYMYILKSVMYAKYYIGHTHDIEQRLLAHNNGRVRSTKPYRPYTIAYLEEHTNKQDAYRREMQIKRYKHGEAFIRLIQ